VPGWLWWNDTVVAVLEIPLLRTTTPPLATWDDLLPDQATRLPDELARIDAYLDDERFLAPWRAHFHARLGRPSVPIPTLLRLLYLKHRYQLGYQSLCREVSDSISWRRFCRIPLDQPVPHPTTLSKLVRRAGPDTIAALNAALLGKLADDKLLRCRKLRVDTTVVGANVAYPTDVGLLARAVSKLVTTSKRVQAAGGAPRTRIRDWRRAARRRAHEVAQALRSRSGDAKQLVLEVTRQVAAVAAAQLADADRIVAGARRAQTQRRSGARPGPAGRCMALVDALQTTIQRTRRLLDQARTRLAGGMPDGATRLVSPARSRCPPDPQGPHRPAGLGSATRPRSPTTPTGSWWTTPSCSATHPTRRCWSPRSGGSSPAPASRPGRSPPTVATARPVWSGTWPRLAWPGSPFPARAAPAPPARRSSGGGAFAGW
jgi:transposase, IS5 family